MNKFIELLTNFLSNKITANEFKIGFFNLWRELMGDFDDRLKPETLEKLQKERSRHIVSRSNSSKYGMGLLDLWRVFMINICINRLIPIIRKRLNNLLRTHKKKRESRSNPNNYDMGFLDLWRAYIINIYITWLFPITRKKLDKLLRTHIKNEKSRLPPNEFKKNFLEIVGEEIKVYPIRPFSKESEVIHELFYYVEDSTNDSKTLNTYSLAVSEDQLRMGAKKALDDLLIIRDEQDTQ